MRAQEGRHRQGWEGEGEETGAQICVASGVTHPTFVVCVQGAAWVGGDGSRGFIDGRLLNQEP